MCTALTRLLLLSNMITFWVSQTVSSESMCSLQNMLDCLWLNSHTGNKTGDEGGWWAKALEIPPASQRLWPVRAHRRSRWQADHRWGSEGTEQPQAAARNVDGREDRSGLRSGLERNKVCLGVLYSFPGRDHTTKWPGDQANQSFINPWGAEQHHLIYL